MRKLSLFVAVLLSVLFVKTATAADSTKVAPTPVPKKLHAQTDCPVTGNKIDKHYYADIQGQRVYFSSDTCSVRFKADPETYFKKAAVEGVRFENIQKFCPLSGDKIDKRVYTDYQGRRVYFCCRKCLSVFPKDPMKYLKILDQPKDSVKYELDMGHGSD